ncbi:MAG: helix-hairpin-helix domain-containing protein [Candidatus Bathyarchaeota archaeon]|nr:helix-hairpin-helix domain-containing protein [Candidatus Bathyarchaeota archaeon]MCX8177004.1 helix-hairpin-helix domain-containing protein [Candidatus Bathyarchaeota archaeon]MDW8194402.1 helix-hairpin-helix domain-containing protein [Nitrososphaerota archaeon]
MRLDYVSYAVAIILFIVTGVALAYPSLEPKELWVVSTAVFGLIFLSLGYLQRPKPQAKTLTVETPQPVAAPVTPPSAEPTTLQFVEQATPPAEQASPTPSLQGASLEVAAETSVLSLTDVKGIGPKRAEQLKSIGIASVESLAAASAEDIASKLKISPKIANAWIDEAKKLIGKS